jgi:hypothetical protein
MTQLNKLFALFIAIMATIAVSIIDRSLGISIITFCSVILLFIGFALTAENL